MAGRETMNPRTILWSSVIVLSVAGTIFAGILLTRSQAQQSEVGKLRRVFVAWQLYREDHDGVMSPNLNVLRYRLIDDGDLIAVDDPQRSGKSPFPMDPALGSASGTSEVRISYPYIGAFAMAGKLTDRIETIFEKPKLGLLTNPWSGSVNLQANTFDGPFFRLNAFGTVRTVPAQGRQKPFSDARAHFFER